MRAGLFHASIGLSVVAHGALLAVHFGGESAPPLTPRDISFFIQQIMPAGENGERPTAEVPAAPPAGPDMEALYRRAEELMRNMPRMPETPPEPAEGPSIERYAQDVVRPRVFEKLRLPRGPRVGLTVIQIELASDGRLVSARFLDRSPIAALNEAAWRAVQEAAPYPPYGDQADVDSILVNCRFDFRR